MGFTIIHLTDIHFKQNKNDNSILCKKEALYRAWRSVLHNKDNVVLLISGDIAFSGRECEYEYALQLIEFLKDRLYAELNININVILAPGNHDCDFSKDQSVRNSLLGTLEKQTLVTEPILASIVNIQEDFFNFSEIFCDLEPLSLCNKIEVSFNNKKVLFLIFNSAWMSTLNEKPGTLFFPEDCYPEISTSLYDCVFSVIHHPDNWFNPDKRMQFHKFLRQTTDMTIMGHEHKKEEYHINNPEWSTMYCYGKNLQGENEKDSAFSIYQFDKNFQNLSTYDYSWDCINKMYIRSNETNEIFSRNTLTVSQLLLPSNKMMKDIEDPGINLNHFDADDVLLSEIFCWPELEVLDLESDASTKQPVKIKEHLPQKILEGDISIIVGGNLSGRTSLAKMLFKKYADSTSLCSILCDGIDLRTYNEENLISIIESKFSDQYSAKNIEIYRQLEHSKKVLIVDNFNNILYRDDRRSKVLSNLKKQFGHVIIFVDEEIETHILCSKIEDVGSLTINIYKLLYFGNPKRKEFVTKWYSLRNECFTDTEKVKLACNKINELMKEGIFPSSPLYLISILQNLNSTSTTFNGSSYGYLYESLIYASLYSLGPSYKEPSEINVDINVLSILAFQMLKNRTNTFSDDDLQNATNIFIEKKKVNANKESILNKMTKAKIFYEINPGLYQFRYPYIFYFFSGRHIAYNHSDKEIQEQIEYMGDRLYNNKYGNIIIFVCHFANNVDIIRKILQLAYDSLKNYEPFVFEGHTEIFDRAQRLIEKALDSAEIGTDDDVDKNEEETLIHKDELGIQDGSVQEIEEDTDDVDAYEENRSLTGALRIIDVLGQIIRNYPGDIDGSLKIEIINEIHDLGMRVTEAVLSTVEKQEKYLVAYIIDKVKDSVDESKKNEIVVKTGELLSLMVAEMTSGMIGKIAECFSNEVLCMAIQEAFQKSNSVSQQLVLQELKCNYFHKPNIDEIVKLIEEYKENRNKSFAFILLRFIVARYLRYNHCNYSVRERLCNKCQLNEKKLLLQKHKDDLEYSE